MKPVPSPPTAGRSDPAEPRLNLTHVTVSFGLVLAAMVLIVRSADIDAIPGARRPSSRSLAATRQRVVEALRRIDASVDPETARLAEVGGLRRVTARLPEAAEAVAAPAPPRTHRGLPALAHEARTRAATAAGRTLSGSVVIEDTELQGIVRLAPGANVLLRDVVLRGSLVSATQLVGDPDALPGPIVRVEGSLRIESGPDLPGVAIYMPSGSFIADQGSRIQIHGDVVARGAEMPGGGIVSGQLATLVAPRLSPRLEHARPGRGIEVWSPALVLGAEDGAERNDMSIEIPGATTWTEVASMTRFQFP